MEAVTWLLLLLSLFVAAWFVVRGSGIPTKAGYEVALGSLEVPAGAPPAPPGGSPRGDRDGPANDAGALRAESTGAMERLGAACGCDEARSAREGPLEKLSSKGRWQQRYFVLSETHLAYLGGRGDRKKAPRRVDEGADSEITVTYGAARLTVRAPDGHIAGLWAEALRAAAPAQAPGSPRRGGPDPLSRRERDGVEALRSRVEDDDSLATHGWLTDDATLVRFLRARDGDVSKAEAMLRATARGARRRTSTRSSRSPGAPRTRSSRPGGPTACCAAATGAACPCSCCASARRTSPASSARSGDAFVAHCAKLNEACFATLRGLSADRGTLETSCSIIMDMRGLGARHVRGVPAFGAMMKVCEPNYPERLKHVFIVRAPWIFASLYALVKPLLNETTASKVAILGDDFATTLLKYIPKETLPVDLGGVAEAPAHIAPGGMVPKGALAAIADAAPLR
ncbi:hypothetical protein JL722_9831 [Aureococcus anophagefferens]|nr:hypothetical protein JL722_9831 [Aureococcus anophagefferens]